MATIDPSDAMVEALVAHLATALTGVAEVRRGWPEHGVELDLDGLPVVTVFAGPADDEERAVEAIETTDNGDGTTTVLYAYGRTTVPIQVDLWAAYRAVRDTVSAQVQAAFNGDRFPYVAGLLLVLSDYYGVRASMSRAAGTKTEDSTDTATRGEWRRTWTINAESELVQQVTETTRTSTTATIDVDNGTLTDEAEATP
jgi:hypothetical protein